MSTALTTLPASAPAALQAFAASPSLRHAIKDSHEEALFFIELSTACKEHLYCGKHTTTDTFNSIMRVLREAFPHFKISEIAPAFDAYAAGKLGIDRELMKVWDEALKPAQVVLIFEAYRAIYAEKARAVTALMPPKRNAEEEKQYRTMLYAKEVLDRWDRTKLPYKGWHEIPVTEALIVQANRSEWFTPELKETAKQAAAALTEQQANDLHIVNIAPKIAPKYRTPGDPDIEGSGPPIAAFVQTNVAGMIPGVQGFDAIWREECKMASGWRNACYLKLLLWQLIKPADLVRVAPSVIEQALQEGGQHEGA